MISRTEGEALEVVQRAEREPGLEQWRRLAALYDPLAARRSFDDTRQILSPPKVVQIDHPSHAIQACENLCPTDLENELTAQQHLFPDYAHMRAHIVTVINSRTRGPAPMMMVNLNDEASNDDASSDELVAGGLYRLEI